MRYVAGGSKRHLQSHIIEHLTVLLLHRLINYVLSPLYASSLYFARWSCSIKYLPVPQMTLFTHSSGCLNCYLLYLEHFLPTDTNIIPHHKSRLNLDVTFPGKLFSIFPLAFSPVYKTWPRVSRAFPILLPWKLMHFCCNYR